MTEPQAQSSWSVGAGDEVRRRAEQRRAVAEAIGHCLGRRPGNGHVPAAPPVDPAVAGRPDHDTGPR
jgi:hypothetical protein